MINTNNLKQLMISLGFKEESSNVFAKYFEKTHAYLKVDFKNKTLIYPEDKNFKINERTTCNFSSNENFVVFECVHRLFEKGYKPEHIELEPRWKLGHGAKGGRADIWVKDNDNISLLIIECKTFGKEFDNAWKDTLEDGGQLFSYFQQEKSTQFVALYASDFEENEIRHEYKLIAVRDNEEYLKSFGKKEISSFKNADTVKKIYQAWAETYQKDFSTTGLFENEISAYHIGKKKFTIANLKEVDNSTIQKKYHEFATILRQHNVSGHENAFDKLVNLFLAKIVDETNNKDELAFYWKGAAFDDVKSLIDRLQKHYKIGMEKFLNEDVTYIEKKQIDDAFKFFKSKPDTTKVKILEYFDQLKYYTNNDFAFIDVHNEKLFYQNSEVLLKIVQMLQDIKLQTETQNQFLGDLFEGFLDKGVKQSEGQFFTPQPIVKFLISALPLHKLITQNEEIPKVIDYACGAGHFLNEYANQITSHISNHKRKKEYFAQIIGIEKEYRLSKVAKVSAFMYGQDEIQIVYFDALAKNEKIKDGTFSVLVANPPYSVKGFLETLDDESLQSFELSKEIDTKQKKTNNSIECFFVERAKQLLAPSGVAAIILPSSVLSNGNIYTRMREILLKYFDIVAIAEFGSGTFGKTGTNTATLFLRRKDNNPDIAEHFKNCVRAWFQGDLDYTSHYEIPPIQWLWDYCEKIHVSPDDYKTLLQGLPNENLLQKDIFKEYRKAFENSAEYKNIQKKKITAKYSPEDKETEIHAFFIKYLQEIEKEKLYFYLLAKSNPNPVALVKSPADSKAIKSFLGYEWSSAKGNEGIKYLGVNAPSDEDEILQLKGMNQIKTPLFNPNNFDDESKINTIIRKNFQGELKGNEGSEFVTLARLEDMLDFSRTSLDKALKTTPEKKIEIQSKYDLVKLGEICEIIRGVTYGKTEQVVEKTENIILTADNITLNGEFIVTKKIYLQSNKVIDQNKKLKKNDIFMCFSSGSIQHIGKLAFIDKDEPYYAGGFMGILRKFESKNVISKYLFEILNTDFFRNVIKNSASGANINNLSNSVSEQKIPLPPLDVQKQIVSECEKVDEEYNNSRMAIETYRKKIAQVFENLEVIIAGGGGRNRSQKISELCKVNIPKSVLKDISNDTLISFIDMASVSDKGFIETKIDRQIGELRSGSYTYFANDDIIIAKITPCMENGKCAIAKNLTNGIGMGSSEFHRFRCNDTILPEFLFGFLNREKIRKEAEKRMTGASGHRRVPISFYENLSIPVPPLSEQKRIVAEIETLEQKIAENQKIIDGAAEKKKEILERYL